LFFSQAGQIEKGPAELPGLFFYFFFCPADLMRSSSFRNSAVSSSGLLEGRFWKGITSDMGRTSLGATTALCGSFCRQILHFLRHMFAPSGSKSAMSGLSCLDPANYLIWRYFVRRMAVPLDGTPRRRTVAREAFSAEMRAGDQASHLAL
jgi:hypothetical protein